MNIIYAFTWNSSSEEGKDWPQGGVGGVEGEVAGGSKDAWAFKVK